MKPNSYKVLIVDDDEDDVLLITEAFRQLPQTFEFRRLEDGATLGKVLQEDEIPDIIFLDLNMPGKGGAECLEEIRSISKYSSLPVMIYSTSSSKMDIELCYAKGATLYIVKPYFFDNILRMAKSIMTFDLTMLKPFPPKENFVLKFC